MVNMKIILSVLLVIAFAGCLLFGIAFSATQTEVNKVRTELESSQAQLTSVQTELGDTNVKLARVQQDLTDSKTTLNTTVKELTATEAELTKTKYNLTDTTHKLDTSLSYNAEMADNYATLRQSINEKTGTGEDSEKYITPKDPLVAALARQIAGSFSEDATERWLDYQRMYDWVVDNIKYNYDTKIPLLPALPGDEIEWFAEYWKTPAETLEDGTGDCEDMANLLASLMLSYNNQIYDVYLIVIENDSSGHIAVAYPVKGDKLTILDPAGNYYTGYSYRSLASDDISVAISDWLAHWSSQMPGAVITTAYSIGFNQDFSGTQDFIKWARNRYVD
jgi:hypothetical protein